MPLHFSKLFLKVLKQAWERFLWNCLANTQRSYLSSRINTQRRLIETKGSQWLVKSEHLNVFYWGNKNVYKSLKMLQSKSAQWFCVDIEQSISLVLTFMGWARHLQTSWVTFCLLTYIWVYFAISSSFSLRRVSILRKEIQNQNNSLWSRVVLYPPLFTI